MDHETRITEAVMSAYKNMPEAERREINDLAESLMTGYHARTGRTSGLGFASAVRLLGCMGILLEEKDYVTST